MRKIESFRIGLAAAIGLFLMGAARADTISFSAPDDAITWEGKVYFLKEKEYTRYDKETDRVDPGYPKNIRGAWGFPQSFFSGVDACVMGDGNIAYIFKGSQYIRYNLETDETEGVAKSISGNWRNLPTTFTQGIDAGFRWGNKAYLFKGDQYVRYDMEEDQMDDGYPLKIGDQWSGLPESFKKKITVAIPWSDTLVYLFCGGSYVRYDMEEDRVDGNVRTVADAWPGLGKPTESVSTTVQTQTQIVLGQFFATLRNGAAAGNHGAPRAAAVQEPLTALERLDPLAAKQLRAVLAAFGDLSRSGALPSTRNETLPRESRASSGISSGEWCGAFTARCYQPLGLATPWRYQYQGTFGLRAYAQYQKAVDTNPANKPTHVVVGGRETPIQQHHQAQSALRRFQTGSALQSALTAGSADIRSGDILIVRGASATSEHIQMVLYWDAPNRLLYTIDGNGGSFEWDQRSVREHLTVRDTNPAQARNRVRVEGFTGVPLWISGSGGHVGIGVRDMNVASEVSNVIAVLRPSLLDFEPLTYVTK
jgi:hypothetical protein